RRCCTPVCRGRRRRSEPPAGRNHLKGRTSMKLVTYERKGKPRAGALTDGDRKIVDLADAHKEAFGKSYSAFASVQAMIEAGDAALDRAYETVKKGRKGAFAKK